MNKNFVIILSALIWISCNNSGKKEDTNNSTKGQQQNQAGGFDYIAVCGAYSDTLPCADCEGIYTEIQLNPDTTFSISERRIGKAEKANRPAVIRGIYTPDGNTGKIKLTAVSDGGKAQYASYTENALTLLDESGNAFSDNADRSLERRDKIVGKSGNAYVKHTLLPFTKYPAQVYYRPAGADITIHKPYLDQAPEAEKAIIAYYSLLYNTGCSDNKCPLGDVMNMNQEAMKALVSKWMPNSPEAKNILSNSKPENEKEKLTLLFFIKTNNRIQANYTLISGQDMNARFMDEIEISGNEVKILKHHDSGTSIRKTDNAAILKNGGTPAIKKSEGNVKPLPKK
jgi:copper homeostasis protein (lipoprotein)